MAGWMPGSVNRFPNRGRPTPPVYMVFAPPSICPTAHNPFQASTCERRNRELHFQFPKSYFPSSGPHSDDEKLFNKSRVEFMFQTGRRFRIVSMATGKALQILQSNCNGCFFLNASGALNVKPDLSCNSAWTVVSKGNGRFQFHCNGYYLSVVEGHPTVTTLNTLPEAAARPHGGDLRRTWEVIMADGHLYLKSVWDHEKASSCLTPFLSTTDGGDLQPVGTCTSYEPSNQFGVQLLPTLDMLVKENVTKN